MPAPPAEVVQWLNRTYPQPSVDPEWLEGCYSWIQDEHHFNPARDMPAILEHVNNQLLESDFADSMVAGTGIPQNVLGATHTVLKGPILLEVAEIMEIGHSAYSLLQVLESRAEYRKQAELRDANGDERERKPMPKFPRSMLQFQLSDGVSTLPAVEYKSFPEFELGETTLGYKMIVKNVTIRRGTAYLEPQCVELKGHRTADRDDRRDAIFLRALKLRLGEDVPEEEAQAPDVHPEPQAQPEPQVQPEPRRASSQAAPAQAPPVARRSRSRSPFREISPPPEPQAGPSTAAHAHEHDDDEGQPRRRKRPSRVGRSPSPSPPPRAEGALQRSRYFAHSQPRPQAGPSSSSSASSSGAREGLLGSSAGASAGAATVKMTGPGTGEAMKVFARTIGLSPPRAPPIEVSDSDSSESGIEEFASPPSRSAALGRKDKGKEKRTSEPVFGDPGSEDFGFDFETDDRFFAQVDRAAQEGYERTGVLRGSGSTQQTSMSGGTLSHTQASARTHTQAKAGAYSQATSATLVSTGAGAATLPTLTALAGTSRRTPAPRPMSRAMSVQGTSSDGPKSSASAREFGTAGASVDVITVSDDEEELDKENVPIPTRHVRRRVARPAEEDVIER